MKESISRIELGKDWAKSLQVSGSMSLHLYRSALALKLLLHSPTGAIVAAATTSLPEKIGGNKNYDYRYAWVRDAGYTIRAFLTLGAKSEAHAAFRWLLQRLREHGACVCYTLSGERVPEQREIAMSGYRSSKPVVCGNQATGQHQHGIYGDIFGTASVFVQSGGVIDRENVTLLRRLADECCDRWHQPDSGIWELDKVRHYTLSKISCWEALARAVELADGGFLPTTCRDRWERERDRVAGWIDKHCWSERKQAYTFYAGTEELDASLALAVRFRYDGSNRLSSTLRAIEEELGQGAFHYRYSGAAREEGCFLACTFWIAQAHALLGQASKANELIQAAFDGIGDGVGVFPEMIDPDTGEFLGNMPQGLTHLAIIRAICEAMKASAD